LSKEPVVFFFKEILLMHADLGSSSVDYFSVSEWKLASGLALVLKLVEEAYTPSCQLDYCCAMEMNLYLSIDSEDRNGVSAKFLSQNKKITFTCYWFYIQNKPILVHFRMFFCHFSNMHHIHQKLPWGRVLKIA
jgi:hypothetical protein